MILGGDTFSPTSLTISTGGTVTWNNTSGVQHNVTFNAVTGAPANIGNHTSGTNARTFSTAGTFPYACTLHGGMNGTIIAQ